MHVHLYNQDIMDEAIAEYHARHPQTPASVKKVRDPLLEEQATTIFGDGRYPGSPYDTAVNTAIILYSSGCGYATT